MKKIKSVIITIVLAFFIITAINKIYVELAIDKWNNIYSSEEDLGKYREVSAVLSNNPKDIWYILSIHSIIPSFIDQDAIIIKSHSQGIKTYSGGRLSNYPSWDKRFIEWAIMENEEDPSISIIESIEQQLKDKGFHEKRKTKNKGVK